MRISPRALRGRPPAVLLAVCAAVLTLPPSPAEARAGGGAPPDRPGVRASAGGGSVTSLPLTGGRLLAGRTARRFDLLGVGWDGPAGALAGGTVKVRTRDAATGAWSGWHELETDGEDGPDTGAAAVAGRAPRSATAPLWTGPSDGVAVEVTPGPAGPPPGLRVELVDPGEGVRSAGARSTPAEPADGGRRVGHHQAPRPEVVTRAGWGADESIREPDFEYTGPVRVVFVHHTATATEYACSDAPRLIRAIYQYHVLSNGWRDIGYNFLVDRCGTVYEGRAGGTDLPVHGAHTLGFNTDSAGVAAIGTFVTDIPPAPLLSGVARIAAWKLGLTEQDAAGSTRLVSGSNGSLYPAGTGVVFQAVSGHRDAFNTECPGDALYPKLPELRTEAARLQGR
ncbi:peptidoglycan recognition protein [Kitasatospora purpeofusca]|uniref:peptidoglycan recognition protein family protein n=1 Tax=Kitasatospora purpeofusca TaxID=67352 RepID=UPI002A5AF36C|nr:peptidoglycan recognition protein [Kitasatospora purpeofusca]MDY0815561.1 peptidoglycan recognition protein [Kitasatospora purpeofusca]